MIRPGYINLQEESDVISYFHDSDMSDDELEDYIRNLPDNIKILIYTDDRKNSSLITGKMNNFSIPTINKLIKHIKSAQKDIKIMGFVSDGRGNMINPNFDYSFFDKIDDLKYLDLYDPWYFNKNEDGFSKVTSAKVIHERLDMLKKMVKEISHLIDLT